ncbi:MAG: hypothetical protein ACYDBB_25585 [Armatimonadota bacterium]
MVLAFRYLRGSNCVLAVILSLLSAMTSWEVCAQDIAAQPTEPRATLVRHDRLPDLPSDVTSYRIGYLPASESQFVIFSSNNTETLRKEYGSGNLWVNKWGGMPLGKTADSHWFNGMLSNITRPDRTAAAMLMLTPGNGDAVKKVLLVFRNLNLIASFDLGKYLLAEPCSIASNGEVVCRLGNTNKALFLSPGKPPTEREFPARFLNWDFPRKRALLADGTKLLAVEEGKEVYQIELPFMIDRAHIFENGTVIASSRAIGLSGFKPRWRISISAEGKQRGEALIGEWVGCPDRFFGFGNEEAPRSPSEFFIASAPDGLIFYSIDGLHSFARLGSSKGKIPGSNGFNQANLCDSRGNIYTLMTEWTKTKEGDKWKDNSADSVVLYSADPMREAPITLVTSKEIGKALGIDEPQIYTMDVSTDGNWLGLTVTDSNRDHWWLLQYKVTHPIITFF